MRAERIALLLPEIYRRSLVPGTPLSTLLEVMAQLHEPVEKVLSGLPEYFDPQHTPERFVPFLARWVDLARWLDDDSGTFDTGTGRLRQVIAASAQLSRMRGTSAGLAAALEWAIGVGGVKIDEEVRNDAGQIRPFHVVVTLPHAAAAYEDLVRRIVRQEKPAHVTADVAFAEADGTSQPPPTPPPPPLSAPPTLPVAVEQPDSEPAFPGTEHAPTHPAPQASAWDDAVLPLRPDGAPGSASGT